MKIYNIGSLNIDYVYRMDHFVQPGETLVPEELNIFPGGKGLNQSVALARAGARVIHGGAIGSDGGFLKEILTASGVDASGIRSGSVPTGHAIIQVDKSGQNSILLFAGANHTLTREHVETVLADAEPGDLLLLQNETNLLEEIFEIAREKQLQIVFNPSPFSEKLLALPLEQVRWWFCNEIEGAALSGKENPAEIADALLEKYPDSNIILTLGGDGCIFKSAEQTLRQGIFKVEPADTTAAGDTFTGYFLARIGAGETVAQALKLASAASAIVVSRVGASSSIPTLEETRTFVEKY